MKESVIRFKCSVRQHPRRLRTVKHYCCAKYICLDENLRIFYAAVNMTFSRKMDDSLYVIFGKDLCNGILISNIRPDERIVRIVLNILEVFKIASVCKYIHIDYPDVTAILPEHIVNIVRTDKTGTACYKISSHLILLFVL